MGAHSTLCASACAVQARWENFQARAALLEALQGAREAEAEAEGGAEGVYDDDEGGSAGRGGGHGHGSPRWRGGASSPPVGAWTALDTWGGTEPGSPRRASPPPPARWAATQRGSGGAAQQQHMQPQEQRPGSRAPSRAASSRPASAASNASRGGNGTTGPASAHEDADEDAAPLAHAAATEARHADMTLDADDA
jgi:hypothetical protein